MIVPCHFAKLLIFQLGDDAECWTGLFCPQQTSAGIQVKMASKAASGLRWARRQRNQA